MTMSWHRNEIKKYTETEDEFTTQWAAIATEEERDSILKEHTSIMTDAGELTLSSSPIMRTQSEKQRTIPLCRYTLCTSRQYL